MKSFEVGVFRGDALKIEKFVKKQKRDQDILLDPTFGIRGIIKLKNIDRSKK